jgi:hypothetical protein
VSAFVFFDDKALAHRKEDPIDWWATDARAELEAGRLVAFCTGSDGTFTLKLVQRPLTASERRALISQESFRLQIDHGRIYWDNTDHLPSEDRMAKADDDPDGWLSLPNGAYRMTVHALDWFSVPTAEERAAEKDISHYVVHIEKVDALDATAVPATVPWLLASKRWHEQRNAQLGGTPPAASPPKPKPKPKPKTKARTKKAAAAPKKKRSP